MRKIVAASLVLLAAGASSVNTASAYEDYDVGECAYRVHGVAYNDVLNIRKWPSPRSRIIGYIPPHGEEVELIRTKGRWGLIEFGGQRGWSHMGYLREYCE